MQTHPFIGRMRPLVLPLFLSASLLISSCTQAKQNSWTFETDNTNTPWVSARLSLPSKDIFKDLSVELIQTPNGRSMHIGAYSKRLTPTDENQQLIPLHLRINGNSSTILCQSIEGGQKLIIPEDKSNLIINHLLNGDSVSLFIEQYHAHLDPKSFKTQFKELERLNEGFIAKVKQLLP